MPGGILGPGGLFQEISGAGATLLAAFVIEAATSRAESRIAG